jgi:hypothetical protein
VDDRRAALGAIRDAATRAIHGPGRREAHGWSSARPGMTLVYDPIVKAAANQRQSGQAG